MKNLDDSTYQSFLDSNSTCMVMFGAAWCAPCKALKPQIASMGSSSVAYFDIDGNTTHKTLGIRGVPTLIVFENGQEVLRSHTLTVQIRDSLGV